MPTYSDAPSGIPRPGTVVKVAMCAVVGLTLAFAVGIHWAGVGPDAFELFCGNTLAHPARSAVAPVHGLTAAITGQSVRC